jgi:anti-sigma factor RsiW
MSRSSESRHLSDERIQDWLDGRLSAADASRVEAHVEACPGCRAEVEGWRTLMSDLGGLETLAPHAGFRGRILDAVAAQAATPAPDRIGLAARMRAWLGRAGSAEHAAPALLQDLVDGALMGRSAAAVRTHVEGCAACRAEARRWAALVDGVRALPRLTPSPGFAQAVMSRVQIAPAAKPSLRRRLRDRARALTARAGTGALADTRTGGRRLAWAAAAGFAFTPVVTAGLIAYAVFSHPLVTLGNLATFAWIEVGELVGTAGGGLVTGLVESASLFRAWSAVEALSPTAAGAGFLGVCALTLASAWVVWRNVLAPYRQVARVQR